MRTLLLFYFLIPGFCLGQVSKEFYQTDSLIIQSSLSKSVVTDINRIENKFWVRFDYWDKEGIFIELASPEKLYLFTTKDSSIATSIGALYPVSLGFLLPKYSGKNKLVLFDTINRKMAIQKLEINPKGYIIHHNTESLLRNSFYYDDSKIIFNRSSFSIYLKTEKQLARSMERIFKKEQPFVSYDPNTKHEVFFGSFPDVYRDRNFLLANQDYFFSVDPSGKYLYVSFQASDNIEMYDLTNYQKTIFSTVRGKYIDPERLLAEYKSPAEYKNEDFLNLLADSYDQVYPFSNIVIRTYRKGYNELELKELWPPVDLNICVNPKIQMKWFEKRLNKKMYIQQFDLNGNLMFEAKVPSNVNTFIGYDIAKEEYYFWEKTTHGNQGRAVIHVFKTRSI